MCVLAQNRGIACLYLDHGARLGPWGKAGKGKKREKSGTAGAAGPAQGWELAIPNPKLKLMD
jgi:hypothetical protein